MLADTDDDGGRHHQRVRLSRAVRDAARFIHASAGERITVPDIAAAARLSPRGLLGAFRRELHTSPGAYLRAVRLEGVRRDLQSAEPDAAHTVAEVAKRWHFSNAGRMAAEYRALFGSAPSAALRYFDPDDPVSQDDAPLAHARTHNRRFRVVLDCEVDVVDPEAVLEAALVRAGSGAAPWRDYQPDGGTEDLVAFILGRAVRVAIGDTAGVRLLAVNPMLRVPDARGIYDVAELPSWSPSTTTRAVDDVGSTATEGRS